MAEPAPIIVAALLGPSDFAHLDGLRRAHFPPHRNRLPAHLTLFHHLPPGIGEELDRRLRRETRGIPAPQARITGTMSLGGGVAIRVESAGLGEIRAGLADAFRGMLVPQDSAGWRPHVTIQNKVTPAIARATQTLLEDEIRPRPLAIAGLASFFYRGGPWEPIGRYPFG